MITILSIWTKYLKALTLKEKFFLLLYLTISFTMPFWISYELVYDFSHHINDKNANIIAIILFFVFSAATMLLSVPFILIIKIVFGKGKIFIISPKSWKSFLDRCNIKEFEILNHINFIEYDYAEIITLFWKEFKYQNKQKIFLKQQKKEKNITLSVTELKALAEAQKLEQVVNKNLSGANKKLL